MSSSVARIHKRNVYGKDAYTYYPVLIIGAGASGIVTGCRLKEVLGFDQFRIFDKLSGIGGTWWINRYPGVACDIPAVLYSFSFAPKKDWTTLRPPGPEIAQYMTDVCEKYAIVDKIQLNTDVTELRWIEDAEEWEVTLVHLVPGTGDLSQSDREALISREGKHAVFVKTEIVRAKIVVTGVGKLVEPNKWPEYIPGIESFEGDLVHTGRWNSDVDLRGKDVIVIGSGCTATQVIPELTKPESKVKSITQLMRTPPWFVPELLSAKPLERWEKYTPILFRNVPGLASAARALLFFFLEGNFFRIFRETDFCRRQRLTTERDYLAHMQALAPKKYHDILTPNYGLGCKRQVIEGGYLQSLHAPNLELTTMRLTSIQPKGVTLGPGRHYPPNNDAQGEVRQIPADVIILANGYDTNKWFHPLQVIGRGGKTLDNIWEERGGAQAYLGIAMDHMPNLFFPFGPNSVTGHTSVIFAIECGVNYSLKLIKPILDGKVSTFEVKEEAEREWTDMIQRNLKNTVFERGSCTSWYHEDSGWNSGTYPFSQIDYYFRRICPVWHHWTMKYTPKGHNIQRIRAGLTQFALFVIASGLIWLQTFPQGIRQLVQFFHGVQSSVGSVVRDGLMQARQKLA